MKLLYCGDVVGRSGRDAVLKYIPKLKKEENLDFIIVNAENAAHGFGVNPDICKQFFDIGIDMIVTGNHAFRQKNLMGYLNEEKRIIRPYNFPEELAGKGYHICELPNGKKILVAQFLGRKCMDVTVDCPFRKAAKLFTQYNFGKNIDYIFVDIHAELTSEKMAFGQFCDGYASIVAGSHTHIPTADLQIFDKGTAYITDVGMCGDYNSVIGNDKQEPISRFVNCINKDRYKPATGEGTLCGVIFELDDDSGKAVGMRQVKLGGSLL